MAINAAMPHADQASTGGTWPLRTNDAGFGSRLAEGLNELKVDASARQHAQLLQFLALLAKWNGVYNLTSVRDPADMLTVHVLDSLSILPTLDALRPTAVLDVGSGAGLPAIPLSILRPSLPMSSVDAVGKKIGFQQQVKAELALDALTPVHSRIESYRPDPSPDVIVSRAYAELDRMITSVAHLAGPATTLLAMKARVASAELARVPTGWTVREVRSLEVPFLGAQRCVVMLGRAC